MINRTENFKVD